LGCSYTEGIGLPLEDTWVTFLLNKIRSLPQHVGKKIPFWSLALGGSGIDTAAFELHTYINLLKPKHIFYFLSSIERREFYFNCNLSSYWVPNNSQPHELHMTELFIDEYYSRYQTYRSLMILNQLAISVDVKINVFTEGNNLDVAQLVAPFSNIKYYPVECKVILPLSDSEFSFLRNKPTMARDSLHPGADWHYGLYQHVWERVKNEFL